MDAKRDNKRNIESKADSQSPKDSTGILPMFDLDEAIKLVTSIHEKALEHAPMPQVAKACGYAHASSTPFYRRVVAARLFGLIVSTGPELTTRSSDYLKPHDEGLKQASLTKAVMGISYYADIVEKNIGKRLNADLIANGIEKSIVVTPACATICAKALISSLRFAGMLASDGTVQTQAAPKKNIDPPSDNYGNNGGGTGSTPESNKNTTLQPVQGTEIYSLSLNPKSGRKVVVQCPPTVTGKELKRIQEWLALQLIVEEDSAINKTEDSP